MFAPSLRHLIHECPGLLDKDGHLVDSKAIKRPTGIPLDLLLDVEARTQGAYLDQHGHYKIPIKDTEAIAAGKKEKQPFSIEENPPLLKEIVIDPPELFVCQLCKKLLQPPPIIVTCCNKLFCSSCINTYVFDCSKEGGGHRKCPKCSYMILNSSDHLHECSNKFKAMLDEWINADNDRKIQMRSVINKLDMEKLLRDPEMIGLVDDEEEEIDHIMALDVTLLMMKPEDLIPKDNEKNEEPELILVPKPEPPRTPEKIQVSIVTAPVRKKNDDKNDESINADVKVDKSSSSSLLKAGEAPRTNQKKLDDYNSAAEQTMKYVQDIMTSLTNAFPISRHNTSLSSYPPTSNQPNILSILASLGNTTSSLQQQNALAEMGNRLMGRTNQTFTPANTADPLAQILAIQNLSHNNQTNFHRSNGRQHGNYSQGTDINQLLRDKLFTKEEFYTLQRALKEDHSYRRRYRDDSRDRRRSRRSRSRSWHASSRRKSDRLPHRSSSRSRGDQRSKRHDNYRRSLQQSRMRKPSESIPRSRRHSVDREDRRQNRRDYRDISSKARLVKVKNEVQEKIGKTSKHRNPAPVSTNDDGGVPKSSKTKKKKKKKDRVKDDKTHKKHKKHDKKHKSSKSKKVSASDDDDLVVIEENDVVESASNDKVE